MRSPLSYLVFIVLFASVISGCAHQPAVEYGSGDYQEIECNSASSNSVPTKDNEVGYCSNQYHAYSRNAAGLFGYIVFRVVVEGIVHAIIYR
jgi:hypothetical protein